MRQKDTHTCARCGQTLPRDAFVYRGREGHIGLCKPCERVHNREASRASRARFRAAGGCGFCWAERLDGSGYCLRHWARNLISTSLGRGGGTGVVVEALLAKLDAQGHRCVLSGRVLVPGRNASLDHIVPTARGGTHDLDNLQWVDLSVNLAKHTLSTEEFLTVCRDVVVHQQ